MTAYLVIREGSKWTDVFRLVEGESVTIGRAPTNSIVVKDERCSRHHAEVFQSHGHWTLRDLDSRNGTLIDGEGLEKDHTLGPGQIIRIGNSHLAFVHDLSQAFPDPHTVVKIAKAAEEAKDFDEESVLESYEPSHITHRKEQSRFLGATDTAEEQIPSKLGSAAAKLCKVAFDLAKEDNIVSLAKTAIGGLFESTQADAGAVLLCGTESEPDKLEVIFSRSDSPHAYHQVSHFLASTVIRDGQAVMARNVMDDSQLGSRDSQGEILATSVICAPIRHENKILGIIHLYSTELSRPTDPDDLEFTLAVADTVGVALDNLCRQEELASNLNQIQTENLQLRERLGVQSEIIGVSEGLEQVNQEIARVAPSRATVLIRGESGVGKELVARAVHYLSPRAKKPFVCINCAALSESLLESELFGHEKGAFTGATDRKIGKFESANHGTLMLDEIGEMSPAIQAKFLRVLEGHPFERVGGTISIKVDVRVLAATNRDLEKEVSEGNFRRDLYFRLHVLEILVPALRKRPEDVPVLAEHFLKKFAEETGRRIKGYTPEAMEEMLRYRWPGNVRELKNVIERAVVLSRNEFIESDDLILSTLKTAGDTETGLTASGRHKYEPLSIASVEKSHIQSTLKSTGWNKSRAAAILGIERSTLDRKIKRYEIVHE